MPRSGQPPGSFTPDARASCGNTCRINHVRTEKEGSTVQVPSGYSPDEYRLVGKIAGSAPFSGVLVHRGWKTDMVMLPQSVRGPAEELPAIAPAEVEVK